MPKGKLNLQLVPEKYHKFEHHPQQYILSLIKEDPEWSSVNSQILQEFFHDINQNYLDDEDGVPYHNLTHGFDVTIALDKYLIQFSMLQYLGFSSHDRICMLIAAYAHDNGHQGFTNYYYTSNHFQLALKYSYCCPLENMHSSNLMRLIVKHQIPISMEKRKMMVSMILGTDMSHHFDKIEQLSEKMEKLKTKELNKKDQQFISDVLLHAADLNNPTKITKEHLAWTEKVEMQFANQVFMQNIKRKKQKQLGTISILKVKKPGESEFKFVKNLVFPLFEQLSILNPKMKIILVNLEENSKYWEQKFLAADTESA